VCGTAALERETQLVPDVQAFAGHIACDAASRSGDRRALIRRGELPRSARHRQPAQGRFTETDRAGIEALAREFIARLD
jgi:GAF domain-containing protein